MFDGVARKLMDPALTKAGAWAAAQGFRANHVTLVGLALGVLAAGMIGAGAPTAWALAPLLANRIADGLDGAIARARGKTDFGGFLDIVADFAFYGLIPFAFALRDSTNALAASFLLLTFYINGASFLGFAILAEKRGMKTSVRGDKSLYFSVGIMEGGETILALTAMCLWPQLFAPIAWGFGALCAATALARVLLAGQVFGR
jgi:phosphatidylglycerophosphate synthase